MNKVLGPLVICLSLFSQLAFADADWRQDVLNHPVTNATEQLLNSKYSNTCTAPQVADVRPTCTGVIPPPQLLTGPRMVNESCGFSFQISCAGGSASISGHRTAYELVTPNDVPGQPRPMTEAVIIMENIQLQ